MFLKKARLDEILDKYGEDEEQLRAARMANRRVETQQEQDGDRSVLGVVTLPACSCGIAAEPHFHMGPHEVVTATAMRAAVAEFEAKNDAGPKVRLRVGDDPFTVSVKSKVDFLEPGGRVVSVGASQKRTRERKRKPVRTVPGVPGQWVEVTYVSRGDVTRLPTGQFQVAAGPGSTGGKTWFRPKDSAARNYSQSLLREAQI